ncbi:MAG: fatty acid--CoA ligase family protein, partial [Lachnospiraceae bacterium]|nr:fatty acid--CoA ligase family protein [Lachnospiraceae bacterium]
YAAAENLAAGTSIDEDTVMLTNMPIYLSTGYLRVMATLIKGGTVIVTDSPYDEELIKNYSDKYKITRLSMISTSLSSLVNEYRKSGGSLPKSVKQAESVASVLPGHAALDFHRLFPEVTLYNVYGTTESGCILIHNTADKYDSDCIGKPAVNADIILLDENGDKITKPGSYGHVAVRGRMNMKCYYKKKSLTEKVVRDDRIIINDIAYFDNEGFFHFVSRVGDIINVSGQKITPLEIEDAAIGYDGIEDCACTKKEDPERGEVPVLYVVKGKDYDADKLMAFLRDKLEQYRRPEEIIEIDKIPRTSTGKIMRHILGL